MEIILAFLVFFGGFTLGTITTEKESGGLQATKIDTSGNDAARSHQAPQTIYVKETSTCHSAQTPIYRDLTRSFHEQVDQPVIENDDCEEGSPDE